MFIYDWTIEDLRKEAEKHSADVILMLMEKMAQ